jgi:hypothetical protein
MLHRRTLHVFVLAVALVATLGAAEAQDKKYPNWKGEWSTVIPRMPGQQLRYDPSKPPAGRGFSSIMPPVSRPACRP